ncbi:hypothetical protein Hanom_Chr02g00132801 [Helianthus anomalus]
MVELIILAIKFWTGAHHKYSLGVSLHQDHLQGSITLFYLYISGSHWGQCEVQV